MRVVAVTGGGQGIGRALAWHFANAGYGAAITDKDRAAGAEVLDGIKARKDVFMPAMSQIRRMPRTGWRLWREAWARPTS